METITPNLLACSQCKTAIEDQQKYCTSCGFPELCEESEKSKFHADRILVNRQAREAKDKIKSARNTLFVIAGLTFAVGIFYFFQMGQDVSVIITYSIIAIIYMMLGFWSQKKPLVSLILGLLVYLTIIVLSAIVDTSTLLQGIIIKVIVIGYLLKGVNSASKIKR